MEDRPFVGREEELSELRRAFRDAVAGRGGVVIVGGPPGIGKTRLVDEATRGFAEDGARVLWGLPWEGGGAPAYLPWTEALRPLLPVASAEQPGAGEGASLAGIAPWRLDPLADPEEARFRLFEAVTERLIAASKEGPTVLAMDDIHAFDVPSLHLLRFVARRAPDARILILATYRDIGLSAETSSTIGDLLRERSVRDVRLEGLRRSDVGDLLEHGGMRSEPLVDAVHRHTDGNPLFVAEILRRVRPGDEDDRALRSVIALPRELRRAILRGLDRMSGPTQRLLSVAAVVGREFRSEVVGQVAETGAEGLLAAIDDAVAAGVVAPVGGGVGRMRFTHALIREVLYEDLPPAARRDIHLRTANALERDGPGGTGPPVAELAHHFIEALPSGDPRKAVSYARAAGDRSAEVLAYEDAVAHYESALTVAEERGSASDIERCELLLSLGESLARAGDLEEARRVLLRTADLAEHLDDGHLLARAALGYGGRFVWARAGGDPHVRRLLEAALDALPPEDSSLRARAMARLSGVLRDEPAREPRWSVSAEAVAMARRIGDRAALAYALEARFAAIWEPATVDERLAISDELVALAEAADDPERALQAHGHRLHALFEGGDLDGVRAEHTVERRLAKTVRQPAQRWLVAVGSAALALFEGRFREAAELIPQARALGRRAQTTDAEVSFRLQSYLLRRELGDLEDVGPLLREAEEAFPWYPMFRCVSAEVAARTGDLDEAGRILRSMTRGDAVALPVDSQWVFSLAVLAEVAAAVGDLEAARRIFELLSPWSGLVAYSPPEAAFGSVARSLGGLAATMERWEEAEAHFELAIEAERAMGAWPWLAHSFVGLAHVFLAGRGDAERAARMLDEAERLATRLGMVTLLERVTALRQGGGEPGSREIPTFRREGDAWTITFDGRTFRLTDAKGLRYLAELLANPGREILALDLATTASSTHRGAAVIADDLGPGSAGIEVLDAEARSAYRRRIRELQAEVDEAESWSDAARAERLRAELEFVAGELAAASGLGGRGRTTGSAAERARQSVTKAVRSAIDRIRREDRALGRHLEATVRTGTFCAYVPDPRTEIAWRT